MQSWKQMSGGLKVSVIASAILAVSIVGVVAAERFDSANQDDTAAARGVGAGAEKPADDAKATGKRLELGTVAKISSNYRVAVTELILYEAVKTQYLAATIEAEYTGAEKGEPWGDLTVELSRPSAPISGETDCPFDVDDASEQPSLDAGEVATYTVCINLPTKELKQGRVSVEEALTSGRAASWSTDVVETEPMPSAPPPPAAGPALPQAPRLPGNTRSDNDDDARWTDKHADRLDDLKALKRYLDDKIDEYEDQGVDEDKLEDFEEWRDNTEKQIAYYEKLKAWYDNRD